MWRADTSTRRLPRLTLAELPPPLASLWTARDPSQRAHRGTDVPLGGRNTASGRGGGALESSARRGSHHWERSQPAARASVGGSDPSRTAGIAGSAARPTADAVVGNNAPCCVCAVPCGGCVPRGHGGLAETAAPRRISRDCRGSLGPTAASSAPSTLGSGRLVSFPWSCSPLTSVLPFPPRAFQPPVCLRVPPTSRPPLRGAPTPLLPPWPWAPPRSGCG